MVVLSQGHLMFGLNVKKRQFIYNSVKTKGRLGIKTHLSSLFVEGGGEDLGLGAVFWHFGSPTIAKEEAAAFSEVLPAVVLGIGLSILEAEVQEDVGA